MNKNIINYLFVVFIQLSFFFQILNASAWFKKADSMNSQCTAYDEFSVLRFLLSTNLVFTVITSCLGEDYFVDGLDLNALAIALIQTLPAIITAAKGPWRKNPLWTFFQMIELKIPVLSWLLHKLVAFLELCPRWHVLLIFCHLIWSNAIKNGPKWETHVNKRCIILN